jgi:hypothetical protein
MHREHSRFSDGDASLAGLGHGRSLVGLRLPTRWPGRGQGSGELVVSSNMPTAHGVGRPWVGAAGVRRGLRSTGRRSGRAPGRARPREERGWTHSGVLRSGDNVTARSVQPGARVQLCRGSDEERAGALGASTRHQGPPWLQCRGRRKACRRGEKEMICHLRMKNNGAGTQGRG